MSDRLLYCLLVHNAPKQTLRLLRSIHNAQDVFVIHVDRGAAADYAALIREKTSRLPNVTVISTRRCSWGSFSLVEAQIDMLREGLKTPSWSHALFLSGTHLPAWPADKIRGWLPAHKSVIPWIVVPHTEERPESQWAAIRWDRFNWSYADVPGGRMRRLDKAPRLQFDYAAGSQWSALALDHCRYALSPACDEYFERLSSTVIADEAYFQTVLCNSPYKMECDRTRRTITEFWDQQSSNPKTLFLEDYLRLAPSCDTPFIRKFAEDLGPEREVDMALQQILGGLALPPSAD